MRQPIDFNRDELNVVAEKATTLNDWLVEKTMFTTNRIPLPTHTVTVASVILVAGVNIWMDGAVPDSTCWAGCVR